jgi:hypothetical protein
MRMQGILLLVLMTLAGCSGKTDPKPERQAQPSGPNPKIIQHKIENNLALSVIMKQEVPAVLEVVVANSGGAGNVRIRVDQGKKSWEERAHFAAGEQRTVRVSLPDADPGLILFGAEADPPAPLFLPIESQPRAESFWDQLWQRLLIGGIIGAVAGLLIALFKRRGRQLNTQAGSLLHSGPEVRREAVCSICGTQLRGGEISVGLCGSCQGRAAGG